MKSLTYYFYMKIKILADFRICISVPLIQICISAPLIQICISATLIQICISVPLIQICLSVPLIQICISVPLIQICISVPLIQMCISVPLIQRDHDQIRVNCIKTVNYFHKNTPSQVFDRVLNTSINQSDVETYS